MAEGNGLLNRHRAKSSVAGSNPALSAKPSLLDRLACLPGLPESINSGTNGHEYPGEGQPIEKADQDDERKHEYDRLVGAPAVILAQAGA